MNHVEVKWGAFISGKVVLFHHLVASWRQGTLSKWVEELHFDSVLLSSCTVLVPCFFFDKMLCRQLVASWRYFRCFLRTKGVILMPMLKWIEELRLDKSSALQQACGICVPRSFIQTMVVLCCHRQAIWGGRKLFMLSIPVHRKEHEIKKPNLWQCNTKLLPQALLAPKF